MHIYALFQKFFPWARQFSKPYIVSDTNNFIDLIELDLLKELKNANQRKEIDTYVNNEMLRVKRYKDDEVMKLGIFKLELPGRV